MRPGTERSNDAPRSRRGSHDRHPALEAGERSHFYRGVPEREVVGASSAHFAAEDRSRNRSRSSPGLVEGFGENDAGYTAVEEVRGGRECPERVDHDHGTGDVPGTGEQGSADDLGNGHDR